MPGPVLGFFSPELEAAQIQSAPAVATAEPVWVFEPIPLIQPIQHKSPI